MVFTDGEFDLKQCLAPVAHRRKVHLPHYMKQYISLHNVFPAEEFIFKGDEKSEGKSKYSLPALMKLAGLSFEGTYALSLANIAK